MKETLKLNYKKVISGTETMLNELSKSDIAGILTASGYAIRESLSLFDALEELGFSDVDTNLIKDISDDKDLISLSFFCLSKLSEQF